MLLHNIELINPALDVSSSHMRYISPFATEYDEMRVEVPSKDIWACQKIMTLLPYHNLVRKRKPIGARRPFNSRLNLLGWV